MKSKKNLITLLIVSIICIFLVGCKKPAQTVKFWHCCSGTDAQLLNRLVDEFNANNKDGIVVEPIYQGQYSDATRILNTVLFAGNYAELPDVMQLDATGKEAFFNSGRGVFMDGKDLSEYRDFALANWSFNGVQLGLPFATSTTITYYNKDILKKAGWDHCPETFAEIAQLASDMKKADIEADAFATVPNTPLLSNWLGQLGSYLVNNSNGNDASATALDCIENGALLEFVSEWIDMYKNGGVAVDYESSRNDFISGRVAILLESNSKLKSIVSSVDSFEVGTAPFIRVNEHASDGSSLGGSCLVLFNDAAMEFVKYLTSAEVQAEFCAGTGYVPATESSLEKTVYKDFIDEYPQNSAVFEQLDLTPEFMKSTTLPAAATYDFYAAIQSGIREIYGQNSPDARTITDRLAANLQRLLDEASLIEN